MGIYTSGKIFGVKIYTLDDDDISYTLFERKYDVLMTIEQMKEAYLFYTELHDKNNVRFKFYTELISTHNIENEHYMDWEPMSLGLFLKIFGVLQGPLPNENTTFSMYQKF
jgi:hypothetical protein